MLNVWVLTITEDSNKVSLAMHMYNVIRHLYDIGEYESDWLKHIKSTLSQLWLDHLWDVPSHTLNPDILKRTFDDQLKWFYTNKWFSELELSIACNIYSIFKEELQLEQYLKMLEPKFANSNSQIQTQNVFIQLISNTI